MIVVALSLPGPLELIFLGVLAVVLLIGVSTAVLYVLRQQEKK